MDTSTIATTHVDPDMDMDMVKLAKLHDRDAIETWLRRDAAIHLYEIGDLDDFFWPHTTWYGLLTTEADADADAEAAEGHRSILAIALLYTATDLPVLLVLGREKDRRHVRALLEALRTELPPRFYAHLLPGVADALIGDPSRTAATFESHGLHDRMILVDRAQVDAVDTSSAEVLAPCNVAELQALFQRAYPNNWFSARMLETQTYFGIRRDNDGLLVSVAGVHVVSRAHRIAALGNITTDPSMRGRGLARIATAAVCKCLLEQQIDPIGLNVESSNASAIAVYRKLGFERVASYEELLVNRQ